MRKASNGSNGVILFNLAGGAVLLTLLGYAGHTVFHTTETLRCTTRYPAGRQLAFDDRAGNLLTPIELQGRAGSREWGLLKNARIVAAPEKAASASLEVNLAGTAAAEDATRTGVGFTWQMGELSKMSSACLSYSIYLPPKFTFGTPGYLPGLFSASDSADLDNPTPADGFAARVGWGKNGDIGVDLRSPSGRLWQRPEAAEAWPKGRWVPIEQEIVLNAPASENGILRMWIDGKLKIENRAATLRSGVGQHFSGVVADIGYAGRSGTPGFVNVSPFVLQWQ